VPSRRLFIYLLGIAGAGKLTIARAISNRLDCIVVDSHSINNVVFRLIDPDGYTPLPAQVWELTAKVRSAVLETIRDLSKPGRSFVFTNALLQGVERHAKAFEEVRSTAVAVNAKLVVVRLTVSPEEAARRAVGIGRAEALKDINPEEARRAAKEAVVLQPKGCAFMDLDVTNLSPEQAADRILTYAYSTDALYLPLDRS
jgi:predicted kinase